MTTCKKIKLLILFMSIVGCKNEKDNPIQKDTPKQETNTIESWKLIWSDEFKYTGKPDSTKWTYEKGYIRNDELQYYTDRPENVRVIDDEYLIIEARRDSAMVDGKIREITSANLNTRGLHSWQYGKIEVRAKLPSSLGTWPAIWMLPTDWPQTKWPDCGEIDIMEHVGYSPDSIYTTIHTQAYNHVIKTQKIKATLLLDSSKKFHTYGIEWDETSIDFFIDKENVFTVQKDSDPTVEEWPFDKPFFLMMNFAFGGAWGGLKGVDKNSLPQKYVIDFVRVYQVR